MNKVSVSIILIYCLGFTGICYSQVVVNYNTDNSDLPFNTVRCIEWHDEAIWVGTETGLAQFKNEQWEIYDSGNSELYSDNIRSLKSDGDSLLWIGTMQGGLFCFDGATWTNYNYANSGLTDNIVRSIEIDQNANIWMATTEGIFMYDRSNWSHWNMQNNNLQTNNVNDIQVGSHNEKYVGTTNGGIIYFDSLNNFTEYTIMNSGLPDNSVVDIELDQYGQPWFISPAAGLVQDTDVGGPWIIYNNTNSGIPSNALNCIEMNGNELIIGSQLSGLIIKNDDSWSYINSNNSDLPDDNVLSLKKDLNNNIWVGTYNGGLCKISFDNGIHSSQNKPLHIYPNLIQSGQSIYFSQSYCGHIKIYNQLGILVLEDQLDYQETFTLPVSSVKGRYYIMLTNKTNVYTGSLIMH